MLIFKNHLLNLMQPNLTDAGAGVKYFECVTSIAVRLHGRRILTINLRTALCQQTAASKCLLRLSFVKLDTKSLATLPHVFPLGQGNKQDFLKGYYCLYISCCCFVFLSMNKLMILNKKSNTVKRFKYSLVIPGVHI